ncbi:hypothetical protein L0128_03520 [candidate division KSB1 bacterium]|nr:hypothetical protein [candidate division KSB1 bacterium]
MFRYFLILFWVIGLSLPVRAEDETLIHGNLESGGYGGPVVRYGPIFDTYGFFFGGQGGWIINHTFVIGGGGYGLSSNVEAPGIFTATGAPLYLNFGYGGVHLEYILSSSKLVHFTLHSLIGGGGISYREQKIAETDTEPVSSDGIFVFEPGFNLMLNVTRHFRLGVGATYRYVNGVDLPGASDSDLSGVAAQVVFKFGSF